MEVKDFNAQFRWLLDGDGTLQFKRIVSGVGEQTRIEIKTEEPKPLSVSERLYSKVTRG